MIPNAEEDRPHFKFYIQELDMKDEMERERRVALI